MFQHFSVAKDQKTQRSTVPSVDGKRISFFKPNVQPKLVTYNPKPEYQQQVHPTDDTGMGMPDTSSEHLVQRKPTAKSPHNDLFFQPKLAISQPDDKYEQEADAIADKVMRITTPETRNETFFYPRDKALISAFQGEVTQRKCEHCEEEEKLQRKPLLSLIQQKEKTNEDNFISESASNQIKKSVGKGSDLPDSTMGFMEEHFGADFSNVKIHTDDNAVQLSNDVSAEAFTVGDDIYFNKGKYDPESFRGKHLLAHELVHTLQQRTGSEKHINRKLSVTDPSKKIPNPTGKGKVQTNNDTIFDYLKSLCPAGGLVISPAGDVSIPSYFCTEVAYPPDFVGPLPTTVSKSGTPVGCGCVCDLAGSANSWRITVDDSSWPHTTFDDNTKALTPGSGGTGGEVTAPSPNSPQLWGAVTTTGTFKDIDPWLVLGHELCGHAWLGNKGDAAKDETKPRGRGGHQATVERENLIRDEHGITRRGTFREPYCGESFSHPLGTPAGAGTVSLSSSLSECQKWRNEYNMLNSTSLKISDTIPIKPGEKLAP